MTDESRQRLTCSALLNRGLHGCWRDHQATQIIDDDTLTWPLVQEQKLCSPCHNVLCDKQLLEVQECHCCQCNACLIVGMYTQKRLGSNTILD